MSQKKGDEHWNWKGDEASYKAIHDYVRRYKPTQKNCMMCNKEKPLQLANISGDYKRDINDFLWLCSRCHSKFDDRREYYLKQMFSTSYNGIGRKQVLATRG